MTNTPKSPRYGQGALAAAVLATAALVFGGAGSARAAESSILGPGSADFTIVGADGRTTVGHSHYSVERSDGATTLRGENRYDDGEYDIEIDKLVPAAGAPRLASFEHSFFNSDGSPLLIGRADMKSGDAECIDYRRGREERTSANLDFPPDTYAGASLLVALEYRLHEALKDPIELHAFNCAPGPRLLAFKARAKPNERWPLWKGEVVGIDVQPDLGFWNLFLAPFVPRLRAWFDPANFDYLGGRVQRYYRGPWVTLVRKDARDAARRTRQASPAIGRK